MTTDSGTAAAKTPTGLKRAVGVPLLFAFIVGDTLGAGIYTLVGTMASDVGGAIWIPLLIALVVALLTAATYAELITKYPHACGAARYADRAFGIPYVSFLVGFLMMASGITTAAALANAFAADYLTALIDVPAAPAAVVFIILLTLINLRQDCAPHPAIRGYLAQCRRLRAIGSLLFLAARAQRKHEDRVNAG
ncbi:amino acid permease [Arthrobacter zhangbolii]|uniref:Amino acid permease n=1 Tax=Arthrobacter zhangbolii TaxID=2886936 RepID=A0A9X1MB02_9MICC|nr:amino acid permease [Arthrobacter zhangbolii]MCC3273529.1 amino acid permease [Arthrobacter zhangbolii]UON92342.1 amino acid permease [Arthrobacter zhangbolii]